MDSENNEIYINNNTAPYSVTNTFVPNASIFHNGISENSLTNVIKAFDRTQIGIAEVSATKSGVLQNSSFEIGMAEVSAGKNTLVHFNPAQVSPDKRSIIETSFSPFSPSQISTIKDSPSQINLTHIASPEISPCEIGVSQSSSFQKGSFQVDPTQVSPTQINRSHEQTSSAAINTPSKVSFSRFIPIQHFFNIHNSNPATTNTYKDNPQNLWNTLLDPTNPFDLTFQMRLISPRRWALFV